MIDIDFFKLAEKAAKIADDKKAIDTVILDVKDLTTIANYFVITTAESASQINAISEDIEKTFAFEDAVIPARREGISSSTWRVIDYGGLVVHVMSSQVRVSYNLENVWCGAKIINMNMKGQIKTSNIKKATNSKANISKKQKSVKKIAEPKLAKKIVKKSQREKK